MTWLIFDDMSELVDILEKIGGGGRILKGGNYLSHFFIEVDRLILDLYENILLERGSK